VAAGWNGSWDHRRKDRAMSFLKMGLGMRGTASISDLMGFIRATSNGGKQWGSGGRAGAGGLNKGGRGGGRGACSAGEGNVRWWRARAGAPGREWTENGRRRVNRPGSVVWGRRRVERGRRARPRRGRSGELGTPDARRVSWAVADVSAGSGAVPRPIL
jgi:hypothetical protein